MESDPRAIQVRALLKEGHSQRFVARVLKMRPETVGRIARDEPSAPPKNPGRPTKTTSEIRAFVDTQWPLDATITDEQMGRLISENFGTSVARTTVGRVRRDLRFMYRPPKAIQALTDEQKQARIDFCRWVLQNRENITNLVFSDESRFDLGPDNTWRRIKRGVLNPRCFASRNKHSRGILLRGAIGIGYRADFMRCSNNQDPAEYIEILRTYGMIP